MLYYTGAKKIEDPQTNPFLSLGGFKSSSQIPNGKINNIFPKITQSTLQKNQQSVRMIVFQNLTGQPLTDLKVYSTDGEYSKIEMCFISPAADQCGNLRFELIEEGSLPYQGQFATYTEEAPYNCPEIEPLAYFGIWMKRSLNLEAFSNLEKGSEVDCETIEEALEATKFIDEDQVNVTFKWGEE